MHTTGYVCAVTTNELGMRKSCDSCGRQKRKCDGSRPCSRCVGAGKRCTYTKRRAHQVSPWSQLRGKPADPSGVHGADASMDSTSGAPLAQGMLPFKRCRLSASLATGLVGMQENAFLSDFFGCIGFLPLATQSHIRETIVKLLARPAVGKPSQGPQDREELLDAITPEDNLAPTLRGRLLPKDLSTCVFWCAVGLGALVRGNPIESVSNYSKLAREALETYSGPANAEVARAWTILAYVYLFCGELDMYQEYMALSDSFLSTSVEQGSAGMLPVGFAEIVQHRTAIKICCGDLDKVASFCAQQQAPPQLNEAVTASELYAFVMRSYRMVQQAVYWAAYSAHAVADGHSSDVEAATEGKEVDPRLFGASAEVLDWMTERLKDCSGQFGRLEEAVDRPGIRNGIGGLLINGTLFFEKAAKGDFFGTLDRIRRCVEVFEKFPGLCRFEMGAHAAHITITAVSAMDGPRAGELYNTLRTTYNLTRLPGAAAFPPLEEWQGISHYCGSCYCRAMERLILSEDMGGFSMETDTDGIYQRCGKHIEVDGQSGLSPTSSVVPEETVASAPASSSVEAGFELPDTHNANFGCPLLLQRGAERGTAPPTLVPTLPFVPDGEIQAVRNTGLGGGEGVVHGGRNGTDVDTQAPETSLTTPEVTLRGTGADGIREELADEDWLEVAHVLSA